MHRKGARWVRRKAARKRPTPDHREWDLAAQPILLVLVLAERCRGVPLVDDQDSVEELAADGADETFGDGIGPRCADRRPDDRTLSAVNTTSNAAVNLASWACRVPGSR